MEFWFLLNALSANYKGDWLNWHLIVSLPSNQYKHEYEVTNQESIIFNQPIIFW